jgi:hypothetical protein
MTGFFGALRATVCILRVNPDLRRLRLAARYHLEEGLRIAACKKAETLGKVGKSYGVIKLRSDPPHWSLTGR